MSLHIIDFEVFKHDWLCVIVNPIEKTETIIVNDKQKLKDYYEKYINDIYIGYNIRSYDQYIFKALLLDMNPKEVNDFIIQDGNKGWQYSSLFNRVPLNIFDVMTSDNSLKQLEAFMGVSIHETSVDFTLDRELTEKEITETVEYCKADVYNTLRIFIERKAEFDAHLSLIKEFSLPMSYLGKTRAQLAAIILGAKKTKFTDEWDIRLPETAVIKKYKEVGEWFLKDVSHSYEKKVKLKTIIAGVPHVAALGGIHGAIPNYIYECKNDEIFILADVDQLYPTIMIEYNLLSRAISEPNKFKNILATSLELKARGDKVKREPYKRICNITYGAEGDKYNPMYDPLHRNLVCIFGQIFMIDLIEKIENFCDIIQSNTDGVLVKVKKSNIEKLKHEITLWENRTRLKMSFTEYVKVIQRDVNNYLIIKSDGSYKSVGGVVKKLSKLDNDLPIVNRAVTDYLVRGIRPEDTIFSTDDMLQFQQVFKVSGKYMYAMHGEEKLNGKCFRVFASRSQNDGGIFKKKNEDKNKEKFANSPDRCFIENGDITNMKAPRKLDRQWYIDLAYKRIKQFTGEKGW